MIMKIRICSKEHMNSILVFGTLVLGWACCTQAQEPSGRRRKKDVYLELFETAIIRSDLPQIDRLMRRYSKMSLKRFEDMVGWSSDIAEIRRVSLLTAGEEIALVPPILIAVTSGIFAVSSYMGYLDFEEGVLSKIGERLFKPLVWGGMMTLPLSVAVVHFRAKSRYNRALEMKTKVSDLVKEMKQKNAEAALNAKNVS
jgi:hypothetical protein